MPFLTLEKYKGLKQNIDYPELPLDYCHHLKNIDVDDPYCKMRVRDGYSKKYSTEFTDLRSAYEYYFKEADDTKFFVNNNGDIKISTDGAAFGANETLPTGATIETGFKCHWMGYKNHVLMTTGNGDTNYILGYYYVKRVNADNTGIFGNRQESTAYHWLKSQLITPNGTFSNVNDVVYVGSYYYFSFVDDNHIEKRDANFKLVKRFRADTGNIDSDGNMEYAAPGESVALATDGTSIYTLFYCDHPAVMKVRAEKVTPATWEMVAGVTETNDGKAAGICTDGTNVFAAIYDTDASGMIIRYNSSLVSQATSQYTGLLDICCDTDTNIASGKVYSLAAAYLKQFPKDTLGAADATNSTKLAQIRCVFDSGATDYIFTSSSTGSGENYRYTAGSIATVTGYANCRKPQAFVPLAGDYTDLYCISTEFGTVESITSVGVSYPRLCGVNVRSVDSGGSLGAGIYFYKISIVDMDDMEHTLSDPISQYVAASSSVNLRIACNTTDLNDFYRVKAINIYRGFSDLDINTGEVPATDYKFLKQVDINGSHWQDDAWAAVYGIYYFDYIDDTPEDEISDKTFFENSGIGDAVKPRYINGKYMTWLDNQLHLANFSHDGDTYTNRIVRSAENAPDAISFYDYYNFDVSEGDAIKGITNLFGRSVVFKDRKMATFFDGVQEREFIEGLSAENGYFAKDDAVYYISKKGIHAFDGNRVYNLTPSVKTYFELDTDLDKVGVFYFDNKNRIVWSIHSTTNPRTFVYNLIHKTWAYYDYAFKGFFKNNSNEYIGWQTFGASDYLCKLYDGSTKTLEDVDGGNGTAVTIEYQSPLLRLSAIAGMMNQVQSYWARFKLLGTIYIKLYKYASTGKTLIDTYTMVTPTGSEVASKEHYLTAEHGESFTFTIEGTTPADPPNQDAKFNFHEMSVRYKEIGLWYNR